MRELFQHVQLSLNSPRLRKVFLPMFEISFKDPWLTFYCAVSMIHVTYNVGSCISVL